MRSPAIRQLEDVVKTNVTTKLPDERWVPSRSVGLHSWRYRLKATWLVFTGKADALLWPGQ